MGQGTVQLDKAKVCEPRGHDWFPTVPGEEPGEMRVRTEGPRLAPHGPRERSLGRCVCGCPGPPGSTDGCWEAGALLAPQTHRLALLNPWWPGRSGPLHLLSPRRG